MRFNDGGSGSFVSADGLMLTNHHVGLGCIQNLSTSENDYVANGFLAASREKEPACPGYEVNVLTAIEDVTARILAAAKPTMSDKEAAEVRKAETARIEKDCADRTGQRCDVIKLYQGGEYHLYTYKKFTDVRLVFAPEKQIAFFGGDPDNFTFPRHDLDVSIFRAYEGGKPAKPAAHLPWSIKGVSEGELVFVSGNPGSTSRLLTLAQLASERDVALPWWLKFVQRRLLALRVYSGRGAEEARRAQVQIFGFENGQKAIDGSLRALKDSSAMARLEKQQLELRDRIAADPALASPIGDPWSTIAAATEKSDVRFLEQQLVDFRGSRLLTIAGTIVRYAAEKAKPNEIRLEEFRDSNLASLENRLYSPAPVYEDLEEATLADQFGLAVESLGMDHPFTKAAPQGKTALEVASEVVSRTELKDVETRKRLIAGGAAAVRKSTDPMIVLARRIDPMVREVRKWNEDEVKAVITRAGERVAEARWKVYGKTLNPDATFTLRLAYGVVKSYPAEGTLVAPFTTFHGLFDRWAAWSGQPPWSLPSRYLERKSALELNTPLNFVSTADIIGGNSGSPTINRAGEFVGVIFDGNIQSLALDYYYTDHQARAIAVDARGMLEALRKIYGADALADELTDR